MGKQQSSWKSYNAMIEKYGYSYSYWSKRVSNGTIRFTKPTNGRVFIDENHFLKELEEKSIESLA